uniref:Serine/threonine-protein phosphatase 2A activator n=1 Tax=Globodera rostochiensis TaxID=31243 RepID=A0A914HBC5_GLORO
MCHFKKSGGREKDGVESNFTKLRFVSEINTQTGRSNPPPLDLLKPTFCTQRITFPQREIMSIGDVSKWLKSEAHQKFMTFLRCLNSAVKSVSTTSINVTVGETANKIISILDILEAWIDEYPPEDMGKQRFGNKSFKKWFERFVSEGENLLSDLLSEKLKPAVVELWPYLMDSFGNSTRIDYGSGHEAAFVVFLFCLYQLDVLNSPEDDQASVLRIFHRYLKLVRRLQCEYRMEPAGSRGVHAIDDFQFLPFLFGSAQLIDSKQRLIPDYYLRSEMVTQYQSDNLFFEAIQYINQTKVGAFYEHSNQLYNISAVNTWERINEGMFKMYEGEVLKKFPVVQHFLFGTLFAIKEKKTFFINMEDEVKMATEVSNNSFVESKPNDEGPSLGSLGAFLNRFRQMDAKKLHQLASNSAAATQSNGTSETTQKDANAEPSNAASREKMLEVVYGNKLPAKEKPKVMCFVVDAHERRIRIMSRDEQKKQECFALFLDEITDDQLTRFGKSVKDSEADNSDAFVHCDKCSMFFDSPAETEDRAAATLPAFLYIQNSSIPGAGKGVFTKVDIPVGIVFGPYEGVLTQNVKEMEVSPYAWELRTGNGKTSYYVDAKDARYSNWMRYINSPRNESEQNLIAFQYQGSVYYRVFKPIDRSAELLIIR